MTFRRGQIVADTQGNYFLYSHDLPDGECIIESVATREIFHAPQEELSPTDRVSF
jgi:hypothetical protein